MFAVGISVLFESVSMSKCGSAHTTLAMQHQCCTELLVGFVYLEGPCLLSFSESFRY